MGDGAAAWHAYPKFGSAAEQFGQTICTRPLDRSITTAKAYKLPLSREADARTQGRHKGYGAPAHACRAEPRDNPLRISGRVMRWLQGLSPVPMQMWHGYKAEGPGREGCVRATRVRCELYDRCRLRAASAWKRSLTLVLMNWSRLISASISFAERLSGATAAAFGTATLFPSLTTVGQPSPAAREPNGSQLAATDVST